MDGSRFDKLTRLLGARWSRRAGVALLAIAALAGRGLSTRAKGKKGKGKGKGKGKIRPFAICYDGQTIKTRARNWRAKYPEASKGGCAGECDGCAPERCFAAAVNPNDRSPLGFACCPVENVCTHPQRDAQCCYPDETCRPELGNDPEFRTICCRPCAGGPNGCCPEQNHECVNGACVEQTTARLPRSRRP
jgi:hypothetical protein